MTRTLEQTIEQSREMLALPPDWDDDGALPITETAWNNMVRVLRRLTAGHEEALGVPHISPCADGSIDLWWPESNTGDFKMLVNVTPRDGCGYYAVNLSTVEERFGGVDYEHDPTPLDELLRFVLASKQKESEA